MITKIKIYLCIQIIAFSLVMGTVSYLATFCFSFIIMNTEIPTARGLLYPHESETRDVRNLDGMWNFLKSEKSNPTQGVREKWYMDDLSKIKPVIPMPVPASYNDITTSAELRDHVGTVWYDRKFFVPKSWAQNQRVKIRFGSVHYEAYVWINGIQVVKHEMGHLPFEADITNNVKFGQENHISILCDNALIQTTVPQGKIQEVSNDDGVTIIQSYTFDFFNYAGIHRTVHLYTTPIDFIEDVEVTTDLKSTTGYIYYKITANSTKSPDELQIRVQLRNKANEIVINETISSDDYTGELEIPNVKPWWPYLMDSNPGYLYTLEVFLYNTENEELIDVYRLKVGVRILSWDSTQFLINGRPIYFRGFGRHEDSDVRGKGLDYAILTRDFNLLKWIGANSYRTSHYPYSEESMQFADEHGIMIIDECPSVDTENYSQVLLEKHKSSMQQLIHRDKNHPSVVMWSIANEPRTSLYNADSYFSFIANFTRTMDKTRPVTAAIATPVNDDKAAKHLDIISFNRYNSWYHNTGRLDMITNRVVDEAISWHEKHKKPVLMSEYGADTVEGLHLLPAYVWTEEYQVDLFSKHFKAFDILRSKGWFIGEFVWNFADFKTAQTHTRVGGNKKGIFTRNRQPKASAHLLRKRYFALGFDIDQSGFPVDLFPYITNSTSLRDHTEL